MAGRTDFGGHLVCSLIVTMFIYPVVGHWIWSGSGWLANLSTPFSDFAGSTVVHSTGAWVGLMGALAIGPRRNRFGDHGAPIPGHSMTLVGLGTFILWLGWFGFNPGSQLDAAAARASRTSPSPPIWRRRQGHSRRCSWAGTWWASHNCPGA